jgi:transposase
MLVSSNMAPHAFAAAAADGTRGWDVAFKAMQTFRSHSGISASEHCARKSAIAQLPFDH